jgi:hypothetical protein
MQHDRSTLFSALRHAALSLVLLMIMMTSLIAMTHRLTNNQKTQTQLSDLAAH